MLKLVDCLRRKPELSVDEFPAPGVRSTRRSSPNEQNCSASSGTSRPTPPFPR